MTNETSLDQDQPWHRAGSSRDRPWHSPAIHHVSRVRAELSPHRCGSRLTESRGHLGLTVNDEGLKLHRTGRHNRCEEDFHLI